MTVTFGGKKVFWFFALYYCFASSLYAFDQEQDIPPKVETSAQAASDTKGPLSVPVYPRPENMSRALPEGADLRDSYIQLEDGSVLSVADWVLGGLKKDAAGADMSDYEARLFLGQVARAMLGMDETMVNRSLVHARPTRTYTPATKAPATEAVEWLLRNTILPGTPKNYSPATSGGAFSPLMVTGNTGPVLYEEQFLEAINQSRDDFTETGTLMNMLKAQKKRVAASGGSQTGNDSIGPQQ